jgi:hypothetical protein
LSSHMRMAIVPAIEPPKTHNFGEHDRRSLWKAQL